MGGLGGVKFGLVLVVSITYVMVSCERLNRVHLHVIELDPGQALVYGLIPTNLIYIVTF